MSHFEIPTTYSFDDYCELLFGILNADKKILLKLCFEIFDINSDDSLCEEDLFSVIKNIGDDAFAKGLAEDICVLVKKYDIKSSINFAESAIEPYAEDRAHSKLEEVIRNNLIQDDIQKNVMKILSGEDKKNMHGVKDLVNQKKKMLKRISITMDNFITIDFPMEIPFFIEDFLFYISSIRLHSVKYKSTDSTSYNSDVQINYYEILQLKKLYLEEEYDSLVFAFRSLSADPSSNLSELKLFITEKSLIKNM